MPEQTLGNYQASRISSARKQDIFGNIHRMFESWNFEPQRIDLLDGKNVTKKETSLKNLPEVLTPFFLEKEMGAQLGKRTLLLKGMRRK